MREDLACAFCGTDPAPYLMLTPICHVCAATARLEAVLSPTRNRLVLHAADGTSQPLQTVTPGGPTSAHHLVVLEEAYATRLAEIAADRALQDDPRFVAELGSYIAQVGMDNITDGTLARRDRQAALVAVAETILRAA